jgi:hypothetical protein
LYWGASYVSWVFVGVCWVLSFVFWVLLGFLWIWGASFVSWVFVGVCWGLTFVFWVIGASLYFLAFLCFCGLAGLFLCILPMYLGAPYAFLITSSYLSKKQKF